MREVLAWFLRVVMFGLDPNICRRGEIVGYRHFNGQRGWCQVSPMVGQPTKLNRKSAMRTNMARRGSNGRS